MYYYSALLFEERCGISGNDVIILMGVFGMWAFLAVMLLKMDMINEPKVSLFWSKLKCKMNCTNTNLVTDLTANCCVFSCRALFKEGCSINDRCELFGWA